MKKIKKILPLLTSVTLLSGPVLLLVACDNERDMSNLPSGKIPDDYKNRVLFNFLGVNFNETISAQFKNTYSQGFDFILKDVEGTIAQQKFYEFFHKKLHYSEDTKNADGTTTMGEANKAFIKLKDDLGLNLLTQKYLSGINTANSLDKVSAADNNELLFQNQSWHQDGTSKFNYQNVEFYKEKNKDTDKVNDPDQIFTPDSLYKDYGDKDAAFDEQLAAIAKHPDDNYSNEIGKLLPNDAKKWNSSAGINKTQKGLSGTDIPTYSKYLKRFQWWLRFRYQQYYQYQILPELNQTLFTMSYILDNIVDIKDNEAGKPIISTQTNNLYISQLQDTTGWQKSNYNVNWNFTTDLANAQSIDQKWNSSPSESPKWESIVKNDDSGKEKTLNSDFFTQLTSGNASTISEIDPNFGANGFLSTATTTQEAASWVTNGGLHYTTNNNIATFTYSAPIYFLNLLQNLDFSFLNNKNKGWVPEISNLIHSWNNSGWGKTLYTDINQYINLSILKNTPEYKDDYLAALTAAQSEMENKIKSLQAKYGRSWEKQWKKVLGDDDVNTYIDNILKKSALGIIQRSYVTSNYKDYKYYNQNEINIWLKDLWEQVKSKNNPNGTYDSVQEYINGKAGSIALGKYSSKIWIVANANNSELDAIAKLNDNVKIAKTWTGVNISLPVVKTSDDKNDSNYETDSYNTIDGLLSDNQSKIAKVMLRNQELIWTRQIVIPFDSTAKPLQEKINASQFSQNKTKINEILNNIRTNGFDQTFTEEKGAAITDVSKTGDLGLMDITKSSQENSPFYYYLYRYVTSAEGVGKNVDGIQLYKLTEFTSPTDKEKGLDDLIPYIDRDSIKDKGKDGTSQYNDLVYMKDIKGPQLPDAAVNNGPGVGIFIDTGGIHFIQAPGITYQQQDKPKSDESTYNIIKTFKNHRKDTYQWKDLAPLSERPGGLSDSPYLDYLQTGFLLQKYTPNTTPTFNLNDALTAFTGGTGSLGDATWWDYNLYFNNNSSLIHWNLQDIFGSSPLDPTDKKINDFVEKMKSWFDKTKENRWNNRQGININATFKDNIIKTNNTWDGFTQDAPVARMDTNIANYLDVVGKRTLWWYDPSIISS